MGRSAYLVTGGAGFIGSNTVRALVERGHPVRVLDDLSTGRLENVADVLVPHGSAELVQGSLLDDDILSHSVAGIDYVVHLAALPSVQRSMEAPLWSHEANATGTLRLLEAAKAAGVRRVVQASSSAVYGDTPTLPKHEAMAPNPLSPYAASKLACEAYGEVYTASLGLEVVSLRYFNVFGPRQDPTSHYSAVVPIFVDLMRRGIAPTVFGDGHQSRDFCYVDNVVSANLLACVAEGAAGRAYNVACGARTNLLTLVDALNQALGTCLSPEHVARRSGDVEHSLADVSLARKYLGYEVLVDFTEGLERTVRWYLDHPEDTAQ